MKKFLSEDKFIRSLRNDGTYRAGWVFNNLSEAEFEAIQQHFISMPVENRNLTIRRGKTRTLVVQKGRLTP